MDLFSTFLVNSRHIFGHESHYTMHLYNDYHSVHYIYIYIWWLKCVYNDINIIWAISCPCISSASVYFNRLFHSIPRFFSWYFQLLASRHHSNSTSAWGQISRDSYNITGSWICMNIYIYIYIYIYLLYIFYVQNLVYDCFYFYLGFNFRSLRVIFLVSARNLFFNNICIAISNTRKNSLLCKIIAHLCKYMLFSIHLLMLQWTN